MGMPVVTVASGGMPVVEAAFGTPVTEAANKYGVPVTKVVGKPGMPVRFETIGVAAPFAAASFDGADTSPTVALTNNNLTARSSSGAVQGPVGTRSASMQTTGKYYFETTFHATRVSNSIGVLRSTGTFTNLVNGVDCSIVYSGGAIQTNGANTGPGVGAFTAGHIACFAVDLTARKIWICRNGGSWNGVAGNPATGVSGYDIAPTFAVSPALAMSNYPAVNDGWTANFGATAFAHAVPAGFTPGWPAAVAPSYTGPGDLATGWINWYGLRAFSAAKAGTPAIRLFRDSGGELDINTLSNGTLDITAAAAFISGTTGRIAIWYDQTGNGYNLVRGEAGSTGLDVFTLAAIGSRPGITANGSYVQSPQGLLSTYAQPWSVSVVAKRISGGQSTILNFGSQQVLFASAPNAIGAYAGGGELPTVSAADGSFHDVSVVANGASTIICLRGTDTTGLTVEAGALTIANTTQFPSVANGALTGVVLEGGFRAGAFSAPERAAIAANQAAYYGHR